jgi:hypothetical protein
MTSQLSWQPPPVTKCGECPRVCKSNQAFHFDDLYCTAAVAEFKSGFDVYRKNKDGITPTCPMWQQQNKEKL